MYQLMISVSLAAVTALSPGLHHGEQGGSPGASPSPAVSVASSSPTLTQQPSGTWTTTIVLDASAVCVMDLAYELVTTTPGTAAPGTPAMGTITGGPQAIQAPAGAPAACGTPTAEDEVVTLAFGLPAVPLAATLIIVDGHVPPAAPPTAIPIMTIHRFVSLGQYAGWPAIAGGALAALLLAFTLLLALKSVISRRRPGAAERDKDGCGFWRNPIYASATWTFKDSWATNITVAGTAIAAVLTATGAVSTLLPGVQLDRYAILMTACGAIVAAAPLIFGIIYVLLSRSRGLVADNATLTFQDPRETPQECRISVPGGASITLPADPKTPATSKDPIQIRPGTTITGRHVKAVLPGDSTITLMPTGSAAIRFRTPQPDTPQSATAGSAHERIANKKPEQEITLAANEKPEQGISPAAKERAELEIIPAAGTSDASAISRLTMNGASLVTVKVVGYATIGLPAGTTSTAPDGRTTTFSAKTTLRVPLGPNVIVADMRSLTLAALVTMFGIGAELGILGILAFSLSDQTGAARYGALGAVLAMAVVVLAYAAATTYALADSRPGSALTPDSATSCTL